MKATQQLTTTEVMAWVESRTKQQLLDFLNKWHNAEQNPNWTEIQTWTRDQIAQCIVTDIKLGV